MVLCIKKCHSDEGGILYARYIANSSDVQDVSHSLEMTFNEKAAKPNSIPQNSYSGSCCYLRRATYLKA